MMRNVSARKNIFTSQGFKDYLQSLRYCLFTMRRPLVGFWDLVHEGRGSMAAAHTIVAIAIIVDILRLTLTSLQILLAYLEALNIFIVAAQTLLPIGLWTVANWSLTTLMDGKGRLRDIYMGTAYAMAPMVIINIILIPISHIITFDERALYFLLAGIGIFWFVVLLLCAMMEIHDYTMGKTIFSSFFNLVAIGFMIFVFVMFFSFISDGVAYFISLGQEIFFRMR